MENYNDMTIEELEKLYKEAEKHRNRMSYELQRKKKEETDAKRKALEQDKQKRVAEIDEAEKNLDNLYRKFIEDYGEIHRKYNSIPSFLEFWF